ncbi:MAG TPA: glycosyltransferase [Acidimicrobiales bacterium]|nr:glycosyltransferase [Acidimicrobiales bacterium]
MTDASPPNRPRALWVTSEPPDHQRGGGAVRQAHLIDALADRAEVDLLLVGDLADHELRVRLRSTVALPAPPPRPPESVFARRVRDLWRVAVARLPSEAADRAGERRLLSGALDGRRGHRYDVVHVEHLGLAGLAGAARAAAAVGGRVSIDVQNVPSLMAAHARRLAPGGRQRLLWAGEEAAARRFQRNLLHSFDVVCCVSADDAAALAAGRTVVVPNGVDVSRFEGAAARPLPEEPRLVFTGTLDYLPNVDAAVWFATSVLPEVRAAVPAATLEVVGRSPTAEVRALARLPGVTVRADVADVTPHLAAARVAVVPVRIGSGSRLKALEAMAARRPVVGHPVGLEGLAIEAGTHALVADDVAGTAAAVTKLLTDDALARRLAASGRDLVERLYRWERIGAVFADALIATPAGT